MLSDLHKLVTEAAQRGVNKATDLLKREIDRLTPEDTRTLVGNNRTKPATVQEEKVVGAVVNDTEYAAYVEYGVKGRAARYHKPKGSVFHVRVGARMFTRAYDAKRKEITKTVADSLKTALRNA